jgi:deoxycytidine triphosphate deaminase
MSGNGQLSKKDIINEKNTGNFSIFPYNQENLKGASYDITPTMIAMSTKKGMLESVYRDRKYPFKYYIYVKSKDTVLAVSSEYIAVPPYMAGYVVSRVSKVAEGFGHVSTSIDPNWRGAVLIALSNPTNKPIKVYVGSADGKNWEKNTLATISFHYLNTACDVTDREYQGMRLDLLKKLNYSSRTGFRAWFQKTFFRKRRKFTDFFFHYCETLPKDNVTEEIWCTFVAELQGVITKTGCEHCKHFIERNRHKEERLSDFIVKEHIFSRVFHWFEKHWFEIVRTFWFIIAILIILNAFPAEWKDVIKNFFEIFNLIT